MTPWAKSLGISGGTSSRMLNNEPPGTDILTLIMRTEHVNLSWLLGGHGMPFMLDYYSTAGEFETMLRAHAQDARYDAYLCVNTERHQLAVVLTEPASCTFKNKTIEYQHVEMLIGPVSNLQADMQSALPGCKLHYFSMSELDFTAFSRGQYGTYRMIGENNKHSLALNSLKGEGSPVQGITGDFSQGKSSGSLAAVAEGLRTYNAKEKTELLYIIMNVAESHGLKEKLDKAIKLDTLSFLQETGKPPAEITDDEIHFALLANMN